MKRLTNRFDKLLHYDNNEVSHYNCSSYIKVLEKLGNLEDIEGELNIDLVTLFEILKDKKVYFIVEDTLMNNVPDPIKLVFRNNEFQLEVSDCYYLSLYDYGKKWSLNKEELKGE